MRISSNLFFKTGLNSINAQQADLVHLYKQVGSGKRMVTPSDDPLAAAQAINVSQTLAMTERYAANRQVAMQSLGMQENVLSNVTLQLQDIKTRLVEVGNGSLSDVDRAALAEVLQGSRDALLNLANSTDGNGQYMFSGSRGNRAAFSENGTYIGDSSHRLVQVDQTRRMAGVDLGSDIFNRAAPGATGFVMTPGAANGGTGAFGNVVVTDPQGTAAGKKVEIAFTSDTDYTVTVDGVAVPGPHVYTNPGKLLEGLGLGVEVAFSGTPVANDTFTLTPLSSSYSIAGDSTMAVANVTGFTSTQAVSVEYDGTAYTARAADGTPLNVAVTASPDGRPELVIDDGTNQVGTIALYGEPTAGSFVTIEPGSGSVSRDDLNVFAALDEVIAVLKSPASDAVASTKFRNALNSAMQRVDVTYDNVLSVRASAGTRMNELDALSANGSSRILEYKGQLSQLEDVDYHTAITQLTLRTTALEAAAMAFQKIQNTSLFNINARG